MDCPKAESVWTAHRQREIRSPSRLGDTHGNVVGEVGWHAEADRSAVQIKDAFPAELVENLRAFFGARQEA